MDYISAKEASEKWRVHIRVVQSYCKEGRIPGAKKLGSSWAIPFDAIKPQDPRRTAKKSPLPYIFLAAMNLPKEAPEKALDGVSEKYRALVEADNAFRRGDSKPAKKYWRETPRLDERKLSAASLATAAAISSGDYALYFEIQEFLEGCKVMAKEAGDEEMMALLSLPETLAAVSMAAPALTPDWLKNCDFSRFPAELSPFLLYLYTLHLRNERDYIGVLATARAAIVLLRKKGSFTWMEMYFHVLCALAGCSLGDKHLTAKHLKEAADLGLPYGFTAPFGDNLGEFSGALEDFFGARYPQYLRQVVGQWNSSFKNWMNFHNRFTKENITTILTPQEYHVAHLLAGGATYEEAARRMNLSMGRIKNIIPSIYGKLYIKSRRQLKEFVL